VFYDLTKDELAGRRPLAKFLSIKLIVIFTFFQSLLVRGARSAVPVPCANFHMLKFTALEGHVIHGTEFWTSTNIADGLNALTTCMEAWGHFLFYSGFLVN
jgi:Organic solute transporter Ostalpha